MNSCKDTKLENGEAKKIVINKSLLGNKNEDFWNTSKEDNIVNSSTDGIAIDKYSLTTLVAKRARALNQGNGNNNISENIGGFISAALREVKDGKVTNIRKRRKGTI